MANALMGEENPEFFEPQEPRPVPLERDSEMQHVAGSVLRRGRAQANQYRAELVVISLGDPSDEGYSFGYASTFDDAETIALALRAIASRLERA